jgi:hypothetical protein
MTIGIKTEHSGYEHDYGDLIGDYAQYIREFSKDDLKDLNILNLSYFSPNTWKAVLNNPVFDNDVFQKIKKLTTYDCPYTNNHYTSLIPISIWSKNVEKYFSTENFHWFKEMACDKDWNLKDIELSSFEQVELSDIHKLLLGSGYTSGTLMSDGSNSIVPVLIDLDNGDLMYAATFVWHNK